MKPLNKHYKVKPDAEETVSNGGIILTTPVADKYKRGIIVAISADVDTTAKVGDKLIYVNATHTKWEENLFIHENHSIGYESNRKKNNRKG